MKGIREASRRILSAIERKELILVHGDYDADGITSAALLSRALEKLGANFYAFLPHRKTDGYGVSRSAILEAKAKGVSLLITADCGISAFEEMELAKEAGIDSIIIDHHLIHDGRLPKAFAIINPLQEDCAYPFKELSACGLALKLAQALLGRYALNLLDLAALSCVCDIAPLTDENRLIVKFGMDLISKRSNRGLGELCSAARLKSQKINASHLGFVLGPRINAGGRMSSADTALKLLISKDAGEAQQLAKLLDQENRERRQEERQVLKQAIDKVEREVNFSRDRVIVVWNQGWHQGVIGIVAQRLVERYHRPTLVIAVENGKGKGSARSIRGFHLFEALKACQSCFEEFGGHELAAGFSILEDELPALRSKLNQFAIQFPGSLFVRSIQIDFEVPFEALTPIFLKELELFEPFGAGNPRPVFLTRQVKSKTPVLPVGSNSFRWWATDGACTFEAVWNQRQIPLPHIPESDLYDLVYTPKFKEWDGVATAFLDVKDTKSKT